METENYPRTTRELSAPQCSSRKLSAGEMVAELERLAMVYPRADMDSRKWSILFLTFFEDLGRLTLENLRDGCSRYRRNPSNRFFPSPGQLLDACRDPYDDPPARRYAPLAALGRRLTPDEAAAAIERVRATTGYDVSVERANVRRKAEILARPPLEMTPELRDREQKLARERRKALARRLQNGSAG